MYYEHYVTQYIYSDVAITLEKIIVRLVYKHSQFAHFMVKLVLQLRLSIHRVNDIVMMANESKNKYRTRIMKIVGHSNIQ